ncbi:MAG: chromosome partition protein Smc [Armatimonadota bacterium]|nr:MAG: chromosome partition protein Smc [Armatimonadota bacterium]
MILKSLSILGFKSFADRVRLDFGEGITAIVGPNGSGKSNIADAIQWVLGEQNVRTLRAENSTEVIFAGSARRKPLGMAEVSLTVDNSTGLLPIDFAEVTITRRLYRSGESEYLINKTPCRLKDILELFMDTGLGRATYAILTQNEVDIVLSAKPEDRRALFEEAAGIQKYRHRKREALRKLENTEANLTRVTDILAELEAQREPLRQQAEVAIRYHQLTSRLREIEIAALWAQVLESERAREQTQQEQQRLHRRLLEVNAQLAECDALSQKLGTQIADAEAELDTLRALQQASLTAYERAESRRALIEQRLQNNRDNLNRLQEELAENERRLADIQQQAQQWQERRLELQQRIEEVQQQQEVARERLRLAEHALQQAQQHYMERTQEVVRARAHLDGLRLRRTETEQTIQALQSRVQEAEQNLRAAEERVKAAQAQREKAVAAVKLAVREAQRCETELQQAQAELQRRQQEVQERSRENARLSARLQALLESEAAQEGLFGGVKAVLDAVSQGRLPGTYLLVADALQPQEPYVTAIEVALGASAQDIITATEEEARLAIEWLKQHARGRATFLPLNLLRPSDPAPSLLQCIREGLAIGFASELVQCAPELQIVAQYLLGRVLVASDFDSAVQIVRRYNGWSKVVTLEGELFLPGGAITGGKMPGRATGIVSRKAERARVESELRAGEEEEQRLRTRLQEAMLATETAQQRWREARKEQEQAQQRAMQAESALQSVVQEQAVVEQQLHSLQQEQTEQTNRLYALDNEILELEGHLLPDAGQAISPEEVSRYRQQRDGAAMQLQETEVTLGRLTEQQRALEHERESLAQLQRDLHHQAQSRKAHITELEAQIAQDEQALEQTLQELQRITRQREQIEKQFATQRDLRQNLLQQNLENSERLKELTLQQNALAQQAHELELTLARIEMQRTQAVTRLWDEYEVDVSRHAPPDLSQFTPENASEINRLRREIRQMGNVNTGAAEEYQRLTERYDFLQKQRTDLEAAREDLLQAIQEIDSSTRDLFLETFRAVQEAFQEVFARLFGGGKAELELTQPHNLLETGVEIVVQPPGKRRQNLSLLSGGERALVALALMFAFLQVKPSPFCVLDEVDAALDGANVEKFADMLRDYARHSQVIIITHNPVTMECADVWYGVTMQEQGVSRVISYRAPKEAMVAVS